MLWLGFLILMVIIAAAPGIFMYLEHLRAGASSTAGDNEGPRSTA